MRLFCELFLNYPILNHLTNLSSSFFDLLEAEQDGEEHQTLSKTRRGSEYGVPSVKVPAIILGPKTKLEAYRHQNNIEFQALNVAIEERIHINYLISGRLNNAIGSEAKASRERSLQILIEMSTERGEAMEDLSPDLSLWVVPDMPDNGWECALKLEAHRQQCQGGGVNLGVGVNIVSS